MKRLLSLALVAAAVATLPAGARAKPAATTVRFPCDVCLVEVRADGTRQRVVLRNPRFTIDDVSPDLSTILYARFGRGGEPAGVFVARVDGSGERKIAPDPGGTARFSPDGRLVAYDHRSAEPAPDTRSLCARSEIWVVGVDGSGDRPVQRCARRPVWAPDSRRIAFGEWIAEGSGLFGVTDLAGTRREIGTFEARLGYGFRPPVWSPAGDRLAYVTYAYPKSPGAAGAYDGSGLRGALTDVRIVRPSGAAVATLGGAFAPSWSPDGSRLAFVRDYPHSVTGEGREPELWVGGAAGERPRPVRRSFVWDVKWSPDGRLLAFAADDDIYAFRPDGSGERQVSHAPSGGAIDAFWWSRDGSRLLYLWVCTQEFQPCE